ncbi:hypothetical protein ACHAW5_008362 [Stephanodiscus triporus]|uniref:Nitroreductase domain-containing protein n=1 Tax=Stephanodiscus triporus TaxID=2934178 RepID=A0ABD3MX93_9STRA
MDDVRTRFSIVLPSSLPVHFVHLHELKHFLGIPASIYIAPLSFYKLGPKKNTVLVAMTYMLACTSRGLATCLMEGFDVHGIKRALGIPAGRYSIPLIVSAGTPYRRKNTDGDEDETDDAGLSHGGIDMSPGYPLEEVVFGNSFGTPSVATMP